MTADDGEFRFPPDLYPTTFGELKYVTAWELHDGMPIFEPFAEAAHVQRSDSRACAARAIRELRDEGLLTVAGGPWNTEERVPMTAAETDDVLETLDTYEAWSSADQGVWLVTTDAWYSWKGLG